MKLTDLNQNRFMEVFERTSLEARLASGRQLVIKSGIDPTAPDLHLGHLVGLLTLREFIALGHRVVFVVGDFTAQLGDGTERPRLTLSQTRANADVVVDFLIRFFSSPNFEVRRQSEWFEAMPLEVYPMIRQPDFESTLRKQEAYPHTTWLLPVPLPRGQSQARVCPQSIVSGCFPVSKYNRRASHASAGEIVKS